MTVKTYTASYKELITLALELTKESVKPFSFEIMKRANVVYGVKAFENGLDYEVATKFLAIVKAYKGTGKRPKSLTFSFNKGACTILSASGKVII